MDKPRLQPGDIFLTSNPMALQKAINWFQKVWSKDHESNYGHAGIIMRSDGATFEALWRVESVNIWHKYGDQKLFVARHSAMNTRTFIKAFKAIKRQHAGDFYPFYRLLFHAVPPLAKLSVGNVVCSELAAKFLWHAEMFPYYNGCNPDNLHDHICWGAHEGEWDIIYVQ